MSVLNRLERKFGRFAIRDLMLYIVGLNGLIYLLSYAYPESAAIGKLALVPQRVMEGEVWRLFTFILIPPAASVLWIFFILYFYYVVGTGLEHEWGSFRFNVYYFTGVFMTAAAAFMIGQGTTALYLNLSLFLAFAYVYPDFEILLFFIIPVKVKYLAWLNWFFIAFTVLTAPIAAKFAALASVTNFFLFFGKDIAANIGRSSSAYQRRMSFHAKFKKITIHRCTICGMTEEDDPSMDFRYCSTCEGDYEYCMRHLKAHEHVRKDKDTGIRKKKS
jgi:membrane associated rhomboid family serine protease